MNVVTFFGDNLWELLQPQLVVWGTFRLSTFTLRYCIRRFFGFLDRHSPLERFLGSIILIKIMQSRVRIWAYTPSLGTYLMEAQLVNGPL